MLFHRKNFPALPAAASALPSPAARQDSRLPALRMKARPLPCAAGLLFCPCGHRPQHREPGPLDKGHRAPDHPAVSRPAPGGAALSPAAGNDGPQRRDGPPAAGKRGYSALPKKSFRAAATWVTYSGLSYRSTWLAPSTTWIFLGSLARR